MALQSMTGFGEARLSRDGLELKIELKSVNHRFLDINCKLPSVYSGFENDLQNIARRQMKRGRLEISVSRNVSKETAYEVRFDEGVFRAYLKSVKRALKIASVPEKQALSLVIAQVLLRREVLEVAPLETDIEREKGPLEEVFQNAVTGLQAMRAKEGAALEKEITRDLNELAQLVQKLRLAAADVSEIYRNRLTVRLEKLASDIEIDPQRLAQEVAILADRSDVSEELARLESHIEQFREILHGKEASGRKLEFLLQEMGREVNTTGSKAQQAEMVNAVIEGKAILEKIREQVLNVE